jgi:hypothetical protein
MILLADIPALRQRLVSRQLTEADVQSLDQHLASFQVAAEPIDPSRRVVAHLPGGLDLVK